MEMSEQEEKVLLPSRRTLSEPQEKRILHIKSEQHCIELRQKSQGEHKARQRKKVKKWLRY